MTDDCVHTKTGYSDVADSTVGDVMVKRPKTLPADASVGDVRRLFENASVETGLLVDDTRFRAAIERPNVPDTAPDDAPAIDFASTPTTAVHPSTPMRDAMDLLETRVHATAGRGGRGRRDPAGPRLPEPLPLGFLAPAASRDRPPTHHEKSRPLWAALSVELAGIRTRDLSAASRTLSQLSYSPKLIISAKFRPVPGDSSVAQAKVNIGRPATSDIGSR